MKKAYCVDCGSEIDLSMRDEDGAFLDAFFKHDKDGKCIGNQCAHCHAIEFGTLSMNAEYEENEARAREDTCTHDDWHVAHGMRECSICFKPLGPVNPDYDPCTTTCPLKVCDYNGERCSHLS